MRAQAERFGAEIITDDVTAVELHGEVKSVTDGEGNTYRAHAVILAMGSAYRELGLPDEKRLSGHGVSWCATCDGFFFRDQDIAVVGGGDSAIEEATFLTKFARSVTIVHRREDCGPARSWPSGPSQPQDPFAWNSKVDRDPRRRASVSGITLSDTHTGEDARAGGHRPVRRDRARPPQRAGQRPRRPRPGRLRAASTARTDTAPRARRVRLRRPRRPHLPAGRHRCRDRLRRGPRRRALPRRRSRTSSTPSRRRPRTRRWTSHSSDLDPSLSPATASL